MQKIIYYTIAALVIAGGLSGCKKGFLDQHNPNSVAVDKAFQSEADITNGVYGVYQALRSSNCIGEGANTWTDDRSDDINTTDNQSNNGEPFQFTAFNLGAGNIYLQNHWTALYVPISRANQILSVIDNITFASGATKAQYIGELKFVRALMYFNLVSEFGGVPLVTEKQKLTSKEEVDALTIRESPENVYNQIIADLKDALNSGLPEVQPAAGKGRASLQAINGLLGQVYLRKGATLGGSDAAADFNNAKKYLLDCYNQKTFDALQDIPYTDVFDVNKKTTCPEIIFQIPYIQGDQNYSSGKARGYQVKGEKLISQYVTTSISGGEMTPDLVKEFETGDLRTDYSIKYVPANLGYYITKFRDASDAAGALGYGGNDWIILRYADIILNLAEVSLYLNDEPGAIRYLDMVRARASRPLYATMKGDAIYAARYPSLKLAILHERRVELAFEHHRWHDLTRFFNPGELVTYFKAKSQSDYGNSPLSNITTKDWYFPVPLNEVKINPEKMPQNPGY
ncbi:hypothetical protein A8C56_08780 [Niabella ginsenosidivorans]|uniref:Carbohydrate-binding protein SusD n=1 Tax=Niabella ginsenosidivorans TaxID=1176587 RepID=A0A1A9I8Y7_9BACT|nr:RagB/SusD family nutrient uptake outer membrane protein [Niabella ginsenosidivorans]ANH83805.1 hypothetical protein A8C56_08780 [Niabella ginsenosidivorans]